MIKICHQTLARNDDALLVRFAHFTIPERQPTVGPDVCWLMTIILRGGKTAKDNRAKYLSLVQHGNIEACGVHFLGRFIFMDMTLGKRKLPSPLTNWEDFVMYPLFGKVGIGGIDNGKPVTYAACRQAIGPLLVMAGIIISKECHAFRAGGARAADIFGAALDAIKRLGHWQDNSCTDAYVVGAPLQAIIALAGFTTGKGLDSVYYSERFGITFESDKVLQVLVDAIFPWLSDFKIEHLGEVLAKDAVYLAATPRDKAPRTADPLVQQLSAYPEFQAAVTAFKNRRVEGETAKPRSQIEELIHLMKERSEQPSNTPPPLVLLTAPTLLTAMPPPPAMLPPPSLQNRGALVSRIVSPMILGSGWTQDELRVYAAPETC
eukprot:gene31276-6420_t